MKLGPDWDDKGSRAEAHDGKRESWCARVKDPFHAPHEDQLSPIGATLRAVLDESEVLQEFDEALLASGVREDRHVDLFHVLPERVIKDDLEESLAKLEPVHLDFERADLQSSLGLESWLDVAVILVCPLDFEIKEGDEVVPLGTHVGGFVSLA